MKFSLPKIVNPANRLGFMACLLLSFIIFLFFPLFTIITKTYIWPPRLIGIPPVISSIVLAIGIVIRMKAIGFNLVTGLLTVAFLGSLIAGLHHYLSISYAIVFFLIFLLSLLVMPSHFLTKRSKEHAY